MRSFHRVHLLIVLATVLLIDSSKPAVAVEPRQPSDPDHGGIVLPRNMKSTVKVLAESIDRERVKGPLLVVWLFDASPNLFDTRQEVVKHLKPYLDKLIGEDLGKDKLQQSVVAFKSNTVEVVKPEATSQHEIEAIQNLPMDSTAPENVMAALQQIAQEYGKRFRNQTILVNLWTDESGDDTDQLEKTIEMCRNANMVVNVVGPTAVLGTERGRTRYHDKASGFEYLVPVKRGPDTFLPERLQLPYWHEAPLPPWTQRRAIPSYGVQWFGGPDRDGIDAVVGPFALTRLAMETGGQYVVYMPSNSQSPYQLEIMGGYQPDYLPGKEYLQDVALSPLRKAVSAAVQVTHAAPPLTPPATEFCVERYIGYPHVIVRRYHKPEDFAELLKTEIAKQQAVVKATADLVEKALAEFPKEGLEAQYNREPSKRWQAWYDLNRGRLLAMRVRSHEYLLACDQVLVANFLAVDTSRVEFKPSDKFLSGESSEPDAAEAVRLLERCRKANPGTPWAHLAEAELKIPLGISVRKLSMPPPKPRPATPPKPVIKVELPEL